MKRVARTDTRRKVMMALVVIGVLAIASCQPRADVRSTASDSVARAESAGVSQPTDTASSVVPKVKDPSTRVPPATGAGTRPAARPDTTRPAQSKVDTLRGIVQRVGNEPVSSLILATGTGTARKTYALHGSSRGLLERVAGLEIVVRGTHTANLDLLAAPRGAPIFEVSEFEVRAADGVAAVDGVLRSENGKFFLLTVGAKRVDVTVLPADLRTQIGARVFLVGPLQQAPSAHGIISLKP